MNEPRTNLDGPTGGPSSPKPEETATEVVPLAQPADAPPPVVAPTPLPVTWVVTPPQPGEVITSLATKITYTMGEKIGEGSFGLVYECIDTWNNNLAAKVMKPHGPPEKVRAATEAELGKLQLLRHPHITYVFDAFEYRDTFYIITERCYCPLKKLFDEVDHFDGKLWLKPIARCLLQAVNHAHLHQFVHQDIHLGNVFASFAKNEMNEMDPGAIQFKLGDLGVAKMFSEIDANNTRAIWMLPPEVLEPHEFGPLDHRIDIYHCGLLLLHIALGQELQFTPEEVKAGLPKQLAEQLPAPYNFALSKALRRHAAFRTENAMELWRDLNTAAQPQQPPAEQLTLEPPPADEGSGSNDGE